MLRRSISRCVSLAMSKSKKRNRNIQSLSSLGQFKFSNYPPPDDCQSNSEETLRNRDDLFGELVQKDFSPPYYKPEFTDNCPPFYKSKWKSSNGFSDDIEVQSITSGVSDIKLIKSLSSSPSWSDENDADGSKRVQDELEYMDRVLRGIDPIPVHYDMDEYKQWMETFPLLSLFGKKEYGPYKMCMSEERNSANNLPYRSESSVKRNKYQLGSLKQYKEEIKKAVIHNIYENISIRLNNGSLPLTPAPIPKDLHRTVGDVNKTQTYLTKCLQNSPFTRALQDRCKKNCFISRQNSRQEEADTSPKFESLPMMFENPNKNIEPSFSKYKNDSLNSVGRRKSRKGIVLPPIEGNKMNLSNQVRSISAVPTYSSMLSAKSMKLESKMLSGKSRNMNQF